MPDTFYSVSPHWGWYAVVEFFVAGLAGTAAGIAALLWLFGRGADRIVARWGLRDRNGREHPERTLAHLGPQAT